MDPSAHTSQDLKLRPGDAYRSEVGLVARSPKTGETTLLLGFSDIDGTLNDEHVVESQRIHTIGPAVDAVRELQSYGIPVGICTARAHGEAELYARAVGASGIIIAENGASTAYPGGECVTIGDMRDIRECVVAIEESIGRSIVSTLDIASLEERWSRQCAARSTGQAIARESYNNDLGHDSREALRMSASRVASAYLSGLTPDERRIAVAVAESRGFKPFGDLLHLISRRADKGVALEALCERLQGEMVSLTTGRFAGASIRIDRVAPIVFGNGENDLPLFASAIERGGYGVLVADPVKPSGFHFDICTNAPHPQTLITHGAPFGHGMRAAVPLLCSHLKADYGIELRQ